MKEYEKLLFEDAKRKATLKAVEEVNLGLFEQKQEEQFDFTLYTKMTYGKKYKGLYDLYQNNETKELVYVCPLVENNKGDYNERKDLAPYAYDVLYLEYLDEETYAQVKKAAVHEKSGIIDVVYFLVLACYFVYFAFTIAATICNITLVFGELLLVCSSLWGCLAVFTGLMPILMIQYRKYKAL